MDLLLIPLAIKRAIYLILIAIFILLASDYFNLESGWLILSALVFSLIVQGNSFAERIRIMTATLFTVIGTIFFAALLTSHIIVLAIYLSTFVFCIFLFGLTKTKYFYPVFIIVLFLILTSFPLLSFKENIDRIFYILVGGSVAILLQFIFWPFFRRHKIQSFLVLYLYNLKLLHDAIFACFLNIDYLPEVYLYERRLHLQKTKCFQLSVKLHGMINSIKKTKFSLHNNKNFYQAENLQGVMTSLDQLFDIIMEYAGLRYRVTDHTTFGLCKDELIAIKESIDQIFINAISLFSHSPLLVRQEGLKNVFTASCQLLIEKINEFERNYLNVLAVASSDPLAFFLFMASLNDLNEKFSQLLVWKKVDV